MLTVHDSYGSSADGTQLLLATSSAQAVATSAIFRPSMRMGQKVQQRLSQQFPGARAALEVSFLEVLAESDPTPPPPL